ncbi:MAG: hypothetical protein JO065_10205 [Acidobacteria bacterium]|nr:hypothetical protein [Acidobacteriota bacterium]
MLDTSISFRTEEIESIVSALPEKPAVFAVRGDDPNSEPYLNKTANLRRRIERLLSPAIADSKRLSLRSTARKIDYTITGSEFENRLLLYREMRREFPRSYRKRMKLTPAPLVKIGWGNEYPRAYFTRRLSRFPASDDVYYGPFASKSQANKFLNDALDLFKSRRCTFNIHPDPSFPGCMYSEMKMCLAPCYCGCSKEDYLAEVTRVQRYFDTRAGSLVAELEGLRDAASTNLQFEQAAEIHGRIEKIKSPWDGIPEIVGRVEQLEALIVQRSSLDDHVALFQFRNGLLHGPVQFNAQGMMHPNPASGSSSLFGHTHMAVAVPEEAGPKSPTKAKVPTLESRVTEALSQFDTRQPERGEIVEHFAMFRRWYYRSSRKGEVFIAHSGELPLRRIARGISRVFSGERENQQPSA